MAYDSSKETRDVLALVNKNDRGDKIQVAKIKVEGKSTEFMDVRLMYTPDGTDELRATQKGVRFSTEILPEVVAGMVKAMSDDERAALAKSLAVAED